MLPHVRHSGQHPPPGGARRHASDMRQLQASAVRPGVPGRSPHMAWPEGGARLFEPARGRRLQHDARVQALRQGSPLPRLRPTLAMRGLHRRLLRRVPRAQPRGARDLRMRQGHVRRLPGSRSVHAVPRDALPHVRRRVRSAQMLYMQVRAAAGSNAHATLDRTVPPPPDQMPPRRIERPRHAGCTACPSWSAHRPCAARGSRQLCEVCADQDAEHPFIVEGCHDCGRGVCDECNVYGPDGECACWAGNHRNPETEPKSRRCEACASRKPTACAGCGVRVCDDCCEACGVRAAPPLAPTEGIAHGPSTPHPSPRERFVAAGRGDTLCWARWCRRCATKGARTARRAAHRLRWTSWTTGWCGGVA